MCHIYYDVIYKFYTCMLSNKNNVHIVVVQRHAKVTDNTACKPHNLQQTTSGHWHTDEIVIYILDRKYFTALRYTNAVYAMIFMSGLTFLTGGHNQV